MERKSFILSGLLTTFFSLESIGQLGTKNDPASPKIFNAGVGGNNTIDVLARIDADCLANLPELTILMVGTNDMNSRKYVPIDAYEKNLQQIIDTIKKSGSKILLMNLLPVYEPYLLTRHTASFYKPEGHSSRLLQMNLRIKKTAYRNQLAFLDLHHIFTMIGNIGLDKTSLIKNMANSNLTDGLHPTSEGYRIIALAVFDRIISNNLPHSKIVCLGDSITLGDEAEGHTYPAYLTKLLS